MDPACAYCKLPLEIVATYSMTGAGFGPPGTECIVVFAKVRCPLGHTYDEEVDCVELAGPAG